MAMQQDHVHVRRPVRSGAHVWAYVTLTLGGLVMVLPLVNMLLLSFKSMGEMGTNPLGWPATWQFSNYEDAWSQGDLGQYLVNSVLVSGGAVVGVLLLSSLAAYALARFRFRGNTFIYMLFLAGLALPIQLIAIPLFVIMKNLDLLNTLRSLVLVYVAGGMSFSVFLLVNYFRTIPVEMEEAARCEGCNVLQIYAYIMLPLVRPALTTVGLFTFVSAWNALFFPLILLSDQQKMTVAVGVLSFQGEYGTQWNLLLAGLVIVTAPTMVVYIFASRQFIRGLTAGGVRG